MKVAADFRRIARESLKGKWFPAVLAGMIMALVGGTSGGDLLEFNIHFKDDRLQPIIEAFGEKLYLQDIFQGIDIDAVLMGGSVYIFILFLCGIVLRLILGGILGAGYSKFNLDLVEGKRPQIETLFAFDSKWKNLFLANLLMTLYIFLWSLLFIIPGIVAAYRYAMTYYILAENPELSAREAIARSIELMNGNKWRLFCLWFSFIGWNILCALTLGIGSLWLNPYIEAATAAFYRDITAAVPEKE